MKNVIFDKSDKGREEIATRKHHLALRLRSLLVLIDGKHTTEDLLQKVSGLGLNEQSIAELHDNGYIQSVAGTQINPAIAVTDGDPSSEQPTTPEDSTSDTETRFLETYNFFNETIKSTLGLRGFTLQMKVERAKNLDDFRALRQTYLEAVLKAQGKEMARSLSDRLDQLLYQDQLAPPLTKSAFSDSLLSD